MQSNMNDVPSLLYLLQRGVRDAEAAEAHVSQGLLQLPEEAGVRPVLEALAGQQVGELLADALDQLGLRDVVVDQAGDAVDVPWWGKRTRRMWRQTMTTKKVAVEEEPEVEEDFEEEQVEEEDQRGSSMRQDGVSEKN